MNDDRELIRAASIVEFSDGLRSVRSLWESIPTEYFGVLDLSLCNSEMTSEVLRRRRRNCRPISNQKLMFPFYMLPRYHRIIDKLRNRPRPYEEALVEAEAELAEQTLC